MPERALIAYATKYGSTEEVAREIGTVLSQKGVEVDILPARKVKDVRPYGLVVIGTAIRMGKPMKDAVAFAGKFRDDLRGKRVALFSVGLQVREDTPESREKARGFLQPVTDLTGEPESLGLFAGKIDPDKFEFLLRLFARMEKTGVLGAGDWRDWDTIRRWAENLAVP